MRARRSCSPHADETQLLTVMDRITKYICGFATRYSRIYILASIFQVVRGRVPVTSGSTRPQGYRESGTRSPNVMWAPPGRASVIANIMPIVRALERECKGVFLNDFSALTTRSLTG